MYRTDDDVVAAVERLVDEYGPNSFHNRDIYFCSQVARTTKLRNRLIASVESQENYGIGWAIRALLEGWFDDPDVHGTLSRRATLLLGRYDIEPDPTVKLLAATADAGRLVATNAVTDAVIDAMTEQARATGHDHYERRAAAFGALARLGRLYKLTDLRERFGDHGPVRIHHSLRVAVVVSHAPGFGGTPSWGQRSTAVANASAAASSAASRSPKRRVRVATTRAYSPR